MSPKELMYVEDALGHEKQLKDCCTNFTSMIQDAQLKNFVQDLCAKHQTNFDKFYSLLNS